jgi:hypothetical protein
LGLRPRFVYLTVVAIIAVLATCALSSGSAAQELTTPDRMTGLSLAPGSPWAPGQVAEAQDPPPYPPPPPPAYPPPPYVTRIGEVAPCCLPPTGDGGFQGAGGVLMPTLLLAIAGGGFLTAGAIARLATARCRN